MRIKPILGATVLLVALAVSASGAAAKEFRIEEVASVSAVDVGQLKPNVIAFSDHRQDEQADPGTGLIRFEDWARTRPAQKQVLSLHPNYVEPTVSVTVNGLTKPYKEKLHMYVAEARFVLDKAPAALDLARYAALPFLEKADPAIKHKLIAPADVAPLKQPELAYNRLPERPWCEATPAAICIQSRYQLEGKLPMGIMLANKLEEGGKKIADYLEFQSEIRLLSADEIVRAGLPQLTGLTTPVVGALEQSIFYVNQMMQFGKFLAVFQQHPLDPKRTVVTAFVALAIETDVLEQKKEYERVPVLRNLVPAQVLVGKSSFNTGTSISAGLPDYTRHRIKATAGILQRE